MGQNDQKRDFFWYIHPGEVWDPITDQTRVDVPLYPKMIFKFSFWILPLDYGRGRVHLFILYVIGTGRVHSFSGFILYVR